MRISVHVRPRSKRPGIAPQSDGSYVISVSSPPVDGKANEEVVEMLSRYFRRPKRDITILHGSSSRQKVVDISE